MSITLVERLLSAEELEFIQQVDDEECALGVLDAERSALLMHIRAQAAELARLESQLAGLAKPAPTGFLGEP